MQQLIKLAPRSRGFHLITQEVLGQLELVGQSGVLQLFIQHSSASLTLNENADPDVRVDMESWFLNHVADDTAYFRHRCEGPDDMPAHIKASLLGASVSIPVQEGRLLLGTWQGIWLGEHRERASGRNIVASMLAIA